MATLNGIQPDDGGWSKGYSDHSKAKFISKLTIDEEGGTPIINDSIEDGSPYWDFVPMGSLLKYKVNTYKSDRVQLQLIYFDMEKLSLAIDEEMNRLAPEQIQQLEDGDDKVMETIFTDATNRYGGMEAFFVTIWSDVFETSGAGLRTGQIRLQKEWPKSTYMFIAHYGYDAEAESDKTVSVALDWLEIAAFIAATVVIGIATGGTSLLAQGALMAAQGALLAGIALDVYAVGTALLVRHFGMATLNKHDQRFPMYGFNHTYMFNTMELDEEEVIGLGDDNLQILKNLNTINVTKEVATIGGLIILVLVMLKLKRD